jgi:hypothetical protein
MSGPAAHVRPFGRAEDLDIPFSGTDRPALVTALLSHCGEGMDAEEWWSQRVGTRIAVVARIAALSDGRHSLPVQLRCGGDACGSAFEIALPLDALDAGAGPADCVSLTLPDGRQATVRPPTGSDQRAWSRRSYASRREAVAAITDALVIEPRLSPDDDEAVEAVAAALADHDPLVSFMVSCTCPACGQPHEMAIDLERLALERIAACRQALLQEVHLFASTYGWTEHQVLAIPPDRRARYRELIEGVAR